MIYKYFHVSNAIFILNIDGVYAEHTHTHTYRFHSPHIIHRTSVQFPYSCLFLLCCLFLFKFLVGGNSQNLPLSSASLLLGGFFGRNTFWCLKKRWQNQMIETFLINSKWHYKYTHTHTEAHRRRAATQKLAHWIFQFVWSLYFLHEFLNTLHWFFSLSLSSIAFTLPTFVIASTTTTKILKKLKIKPFSTPSVRFVLQPLGCGTNLSHYPVTLAKMQSNGNSFYYSDSILENSMDRVHTETDTHTIFTIRRLPTFKITLNGFMHYPW